jgi:phage tail-like protein
MADRIPYKNFRFTVELDGITQGGFSEVIIPDSTQDVIEYREGNELTITSRKQPGIIKYGNVILKWGITDSMELYNWRKLVEDGKSKEYRRNMAIMLIDEEGNPKSRWEFSEAWPIKYKAPNLNALGKEIAIESIEIAYDGMRRTK